MVAGTSPLLQKCFSLQSCDRIRVKWKNRLSKKQYFGIMDQNRVRLTVRIWLMGSYQASLVRSHLEYANSVWNPHRLGLIKDLEKVQMRATKLVISIKNLTYKDRLKRLKLPTLKI